VSPDRLEHLQHLADRLAGKTRLCEVLAQVLPSDATRTALLGRLRELAEDHLQYGSALRRLVDDTETEGAPCEI
jgi:hypothetical protein